MELSAESVIETLKLSPLPFEGGYFRQTYRSNGELFPEEAKGVSHVFSTAIYYLVTPDSFSALHRVWQDEVFHFYLGDAVQMWQLDETGESRSVVLGPKLLSGQVPQAVVPGGVWQGMRLLPQGKWALLGATVAPGYEPSDFELASQVKLLQQFPHHRESILNFTRS